MQITILEIDPRMQRGEGVSPRATAASAPDATAASATHGEITAGGVTIAGESPQDVPMLDAGGDGESGFRISGYKGVGEGNASAGVSAHSSGVEELAASATAPVPPTLDFTAFQFAAPSSTTRIGALLIITSSLPPPAHPTHSPTHPDSCIASQLPRASESLNLNAESELSIARFSCLHIS